METSDSECFESADEDFCSDDEQKRDAKSDTISKLVENSKKLSISSKSEGKRHQISESEDKVVADGKCVVDKVIKDDISRESDEDLTCKISPIRTECSEPSDENLTRKTPPIREECWEPGMNYDITKQDDCKKESTNENKTGTSSDLKCQIPPVVSSNRYDKENDIRIQSTNSQNKSKRPEFGIPPARTTCWVPGATNVQQPFEPHPAYLELMKKKGENNKSASKEIKDVKKEEDQSSQVTQDEHSKENMWEDEDDWADFDIPSENQGRISQSKDEKIKSVKENKEIEENMWENDDWEPLEPQQQIQEKSNLIQEVSQGEKSSWSGWGSWGLTSVINTATTLTSHMSQGITNVLETGIGAPDPIELARINKLEKEKIKSPSIEEDRGEMGIQAEKQILGFGLGNLMQLVETTGTKMISGGLDTLETIGKKTMEVLQENDPGLKKKRAFLKLDDDKPILSQLLREAKEKAEQENKELEKKHFARKANYETLFDDHQGLVHLEALEMLSKQCDIKLQSLLESTTGEALSEMQETLDQVKELCELPEEDEEENLSTEEIKERLESAVSEINVKITYKRLISTWQEVEDWLGKLNLNICNKNELHQQAIESLAQLTAIAVEQFHKAGELLLVKDHRSTADEADSLVQLTTTVTTLVGIVAARFSEKLNMIAVESSEKEEVNGLITNVFFEAANSSSYIQDAFQLLIPVLQVGAV